LIKIVYPHLKSDIIHKRLFLTTYKNKQIVNLKEALIWLLLLVYPLYLHDNDKSLRS